MAIIYTYPTKATPVDADLILISDSESNPVNQTKQVTVGSLPFSNNAGTVTSVGLSMPSAFEVGNSPVTGSGTISVATVGGNAGQFLSYDGTWRTPAGGAANPGGADTQVQYNDGGASFGAGAFFTTNKSSKVDIAYELGLKGDGGSNQGLLKLYCEAGTAHHVGIKGPNHIGGTPASYTIQLPNSIATTSAHSSGGRILESDASGELKWIATPTGSGSTPAAGSTGQVQYNDGSNGFAASTNMTFTDSGTTALFQVRNIVQLRGGGGNAGILKLWSTDDSTRVELQGPPTGGANYSLAMPASVGTANQVLKLPASPGTTNQLVWGDATGGVTYTFSTGLSESGGTVTLNAGLNNLTDVSFATGANGSLYVGQISSQLSGTPVGNVTLGGGAAKVATTAYDNTVIGSDAAVAITQGYNNVTIGSDVAATLTTGNNNVIIGEAANIASPTLSSTTVIGQGASGAADCTVIGKGATASTNGTAIGSGATAAGGGIAIGKDASAAANEIELNGITNSIVSTTGNTAAGDLKITINGTVYYIALRTYVP